jgi:predicted lipoprotein with Yx(FWY)xxD motif
MKMLFTAGVVGVVALMLGACGGGGGNGTTAGMAAAGSSSANRGEAVSVKTIDGIGDALVGPDGMVLYTPDQEAHGKVLCTGPCTSFWKPLKPIGSGPAASSDAGKLGVLKRPDGTMQVTANGKPLYTFVEDTAGEVKGDGFSDDFGGQHFTWHAVVAGGKPAGAGSSSGDASGGSSGGDSYSNGGY